MLCNPIYLDYHSTTPVDPRVINKIVEYMSIHYGNSGDNISYYHSIEAEKGVEKAKKNISELINCKSQEIIFTSGATESINLAILGIIKKESLKKQKIAILPIEHKSVISVCEYLERYFNCEIIRLQIDSKGRIDLENLENICKNGLSLLCIMAVNNEIGNIYPIKEVGEIAERYNIPFFCDASQALGRIKVDFKAWKTNLLAISAHKIYGPKGVGALIIRKGTNIEPIIFGGGQQKGIRPGTLNIPGIVGLGEATYLRNIEMEIDEIEIKKKRNKLLKLLKSKFKNIIVNGDEKSKISGNLNISFLGIPNDILLSRLNQKVAISTGSACTSGIERQSYVLKELKLPEEIINSSIRICIGKFTTYDEIDLVANIIIKEINYIKNNI